MTNKSDKARLTTRSAFTSEAQGLFSKARELWAVAAIRWEAVGSRDNAAMAKSRCHRCEVLSIDDEEE